MMDEPTADAERLDLIIQAFGERRRDPLLFSDHCKHSLNFFAEFERAPSSLLISPVFYFKSKLSNLIHRDVHITGAKPGCIVIFFGVDGVGSTLWGDLCENNNFKSILELCDIKIVYSQGLYLRRQPEHSGLQRYVIGRQSDGGAHYLTHLI